LILDEGLCEAGLQQCFRLAQYFQDKTLTHVFCSEQKRATQVRNIESLCTNITTYDIIRQYHKLNNPTQSWQYAQPSDINGRDYGRLTGHSREKEERNAKEQGLKWDEYLETCGAEVIVSKLPLC
jgi:bisphosphoglycerate-dependent phosphoglycerate mutase